MPAGPVLPRGTRPLTVDSADGVRLTGVLVPAVRPRALRPGERALTFVVAHGFTGGVRRGSSMRVAGWLRPFGDVRALDFRGHGGSGGGTTVGGDGELRDLDAAVRAAREDERADEAFTEMLVARAAAEAARRLEREPRP